MSASTNSAGDLDERANRRFDVAREIVRHEDGLVNNRVTWLLVLQGFLVAAFVNGLGLYQKPVGKGHSWQLTVGLFLICLLGIYSALTAANVIALATTRINGVKDWFGKKPDFPDVSGPWPESSYYWLFSTGRMPLAFATVWVVLILLLILTSLGPVSASLGWLGANAAAGIVGRERERGLVKKI